jgi:hypothetical protein
MGPLPSHIVGPVPIFESMAMDGLPTWILATRGKTNKCWGVVFVCTATWAVHVEVSMSYSADLFLMALRRFMSIRGAPRRLQSDQGDQLVAAAKCITTWYRSKVHERCEKKGTTWRLVLTGGQHYTSQAERVIGFLKLSLEQILMDKRCSLEEVLTLLYEAAQIVNSRPNARGLPTEDPTSGGPIMPLHLMLGRAMVEIPEVNFDLQPSLTLRMQHVEDIKKEFW